MEEKGREVSSASWDGGGGAGGAYRILCNRLPLLC